MSRPRSSKGAPNREALPLYTIVGSAWEEILELLDSTTRPRDEDAVNAIASPDAERQGEG